MHAWVNANLKDYRLCLLLSFLCFPFFTFAGEYSSQIIHAQLLQKDSDYFLNADIDIPLSPTAKEAIDSSIGLSWQLQLEVKQQRQWWDKAVFRQNYLYQIRYHALLNSYSVSNQTTGEIQRFSSLNKALRGMSQIRMLKAFPSSLIEKNKNYRVMLRLFFNRENLPVPLIAVSYLDSAWNLSSHWYLWNLNQLQ